MPKVVECASHGQSGAAFVCEHVLPDGPPRGFFWSGEPGVDDEPCGWCSRCEAARIAGGGDWTEETEVALGKVRLVCTDCFAALRLLHSAECEPQSGDGTSPD